MVLGQPLKPNIFKSCFIGLIIILIISGIYGGVSHIMWHREWRKSVISLDDIFDNGLEDTDRDGLLDQYEEMFGTDINISDSDGDGLLDGEEVLEEPYSDPTKKDSDEDGTPDNLDDTPLGGLNDAMGDDTGSEEEFDDDFERLKNSFENLSNIEMKEPHRVYRFKGITDSIWASAYIFLLGIPLFCYFIVFNNRRKNRGLNIRPLGLGGTYFTSLLILFLNGIEVDFFFYLLVREVPMGYFGIFIIVPILYFIMIILAIPIIILSRKERKIIDIFLKYPRERYRISQLSRRTNLSKKRVVKILGTLIKRNWILGKIDNDTFILDS